MNCERCNQPIPELRAKRRAKYCSEICKKRSGNDRHFIKHIKSNRPRVAKFCMKCNKSLEGMQWSAKYCSEECKKWIHTRKDGHRRRVLKRGQECISYSHQEWKKLQARFNFKCAYCNKKDILEQDHVIPLSRGGRHAIANILPACKACNRSKGSKFYFEWKISLKKL